MTLGELLYTVRKSQNISQNDLCKGICSISQYSRLENDQILLEKIVVDRILERLGKNASAMEFVIDDEDFYYARIRMLIDEKILNGDLESAKALLNEYIFSCPDSSKRIHLQYIYEKMAEIEYRLGRLKTCEKCAEISLKMVGINSTQISIKLFSIIELKAFYYLSVSSDKYKDCLKILNQYLDSLEHESYEIKLLSAEVKYQMAKRSYQNKGEDTLLLLENAEKYIKKEYILDNLYEVLTLKKCILGNDFEEESLLKRLKSIKMK